MVSAFRSVNFGGYKRGNGDGKVMLVCNMSFFGSSSTPGGSFGRFMNFEPDTDEPEQPETSSGLQHLDSPKFGSILWDKKPDDPVSPRKGDNVNLTLPSPPELPNKPFDPPATPPPRYKPMFYISSTSSGLDSMERPSFFISSSELTPPDNLYLEPPRSSMMPYPQEEIHPENDFAWPWFSRGVNYVRSSPAVLQSGLSKETETKNKNTKNEDEKPALDLTVPGINEKDVNRTLTEKH